MKQYKNIQIKHITEIPPNVHKNWDRCSKRIESVIAGNNELLPFDSTQRIRMTENVSLLYLSIHA